MTILFDRPIVVEKPAPILAPLPWVDPKQQAREILAGAEYLLKRDGWTQNAWISAKGKRCVGQAIYDAGRDYPPQAERIAGRAFEKTVGVRNVPDWNDKLWRTKWSVLRALRKARRSL